MAKTKTALLLLVAVLLLGAALLVKKPTWIDSLPWAIGTDDKELWRKDGTM